MTNQEKINLLIQITKDNLKKYEAMSKLKTSKCIINEALKDSVALSMYLNQSKEVIK